MKLYWIGQLWDKEHKMQINDIFNLNQYDEAFKFVSENQGTTIKDLGDGQYQIVEFPKPTVEEQNEAIRQTRENLYIQTSDKLKADYDEALARGASNAEQLKKEWLASKDKIRAENPYIDNKEKKGDNELLKIQEVNMNNDNENLAMKLFEKQLRRSEFHFYAVCFLFFVFMVFAYLWPTVSEIKQSVENSQNVSQGVNDESGAKR